MAYGHPGGSPRRLIRCGACSRGFGGSIHGLELGQGLLQAGQPRWLVRRLRWLCRYTAARQFVTRAAAGVEPPLQSSPVVLFSLAYAVIRLVLEALIVHGRANAGLRAEVPALRHQLRVLERQAGRPRWQPCDRLLLAAISRILIRPAWRSLLPSPETLLRWHRELVRGRWAAYRRRPRRAA
jgi:hypothetical protein